LPTLPPLIQALVYTGIGVLTIVVLGLCEFGIAPTLEKPQPPVVVTLKPPSHRPVPSRRVVKTAGDTAKTPETDTGGMPMDAEDEENETEVDIEAIKALQAAITEARIDEFDHLWRADEAWWSYRSDIRSCHRTIYIGNAGISYNQARARCLANPYYQR